MWEEANTVIQKKRNQESNSEIRGDGLESDWQRLMGLKKDGGGGGHDWE